tara:strand:+ start:380 stop:712 length:333 start_codon:yes stop_codon:yes gene_type:complete
MERNDKVFNTMMSEGSNPMEYTGTLPLTLEEFPLVPNENGSFSNIVTGQYTLNDGKVVLFPTMRKGQKLTNEQIREMIREGLHFGVYNSRAEANWVDMQIHEEFKKMYEE